MATRSDAGSTTSRSSWRRPAPPRPRWGDEYGHPHGLAARIEERYRRVDAGTLEVVVTIDDREMYQKPFVAMKLALKRGKELEEQLCVPSEALNYLEVVAKPAGEKQ